jgi:hypothetical protein
MTIVFTFLSLIFRFQAIVRGCHSTGAMYMTLCNNPRGIRFLREETILVFVFSGPHEPTQEQFNNISSVFVAKMQRLYNGEYFIEPILDGNNGITFKGAEFRVYGEKESIISHSFIQTNVSDLPASRKCSGLHGHTSKYFMCPICDMPFFRLVDPDCFDPTSACSTTYLFPILTNRFSIQNLHIGVTGSI